MPFALIPWFELPSLSLGPFTIQSFGVLSALGILAAVEPRGARRAGDSGRNPQVILDFAVAGVLTGVVVGHLVHLFFYHPEELEEPWRDPQVLGGALVDGRAPRRHPRGGLVLPAASGSGSTTTGRVRARRRAGVGRRAHRLLHRARSPRGRIRTSSSRCASRTARRHDLGLYEAILLLSLAAVLWVFHRRGRHARAAPRRCSRVVYGIGRFLLDFLRARDVAYADARYLGLTPAQYVAPRSSPTAHGAVAAARGRGRGRRRRRRGPVIQRRPMGDSRAPVRAALVHAGGPSRPGRP